MISQLNRSNSFGAKSSPADGRFWITLDPYDPAILYMNQNPTTPVADTTGASNNSLIVRVMDFRPRLPCSVDFLKLKLYSL